MTLREQIDTEIFSREADPEMFEQLMEKIRYWAINLERKVYVQSTDLEEFAEAYEKAVEEETQSE